MKKAILHGTGMIKRFEETEVSYGIDIDVYEGDFTVIMGSSGLGKSTLLYAVSGMDRLSEGSIFTGRGKLLLTPYQGRDGMRAFGLCFCGTERPRKLHKG